MKRSPPLLLAVLLAATACREDLRQPRAGQMPPPATAAIAAADERWSRKSGPVPCTPVEGDLRVRARIGGSANPPAAEVFTSVEDVAVGPDDRTYVLDGMESRVRAYDRGGKYLFAFGGKGRGPGELTRPIALAVANGRVYVLDGGEGRISVYSGEGSYLTGWRFARHLPALSTAQTLAVAGGDVYIGLHYLLLGGATKLTGPVHGVLKTDTAGNTPVLFDALSGDDLRRGSYRNIPIPNRMVAADERFVAVGDLWNRTVRVFTRAGEPVLEFASCLPVDPNAEGRPASRPGNAVGGWNVGSRITALGNGRFVRLTPYVDQASGLRQHLEILDVPGRRAWAIQIPPQGGNWRRYTAAAVGRRIVVFTNSYGEFVEWTDRAPLEQPPQHGASRGLR